MTPRNLRVLTGLCAVAFALIVAVPHRHGEGAHPYRAESCRVCKVQESLSVTPLPAGPVLASWDAVVTIVESHRDTPPSRAAASSGSPRAPPLAS